MPCRRIIKYAQNLSTEELQQRVKQNFRNYILENEMLEADKQQLIQLCETKIDEIHRLIADYEKQRNTAIRLYSVPVSDMLPAFKTEPVEKLLELALLL